MCDYEQFLVISERGPRSALAHPHEPEKAPRERAHQHEGEKSMPRSVRAVLRRRRFSPCSAIVSLHQEPKTIAMVMRAGRAPVFASVS